MIPPRSNMLCKRVFFVVNDGEQEGKKTHGTSFQTYNYLHPIPFA